MSQKEKIFYSRTYRRFKVDKKHTLLYFLLVIIPTLILFILALPKITQSLSYVTHYVLQSYFPDIPLQTVTAPIPLLGDISYIELSTVYPSFNSISLNIIVMLVLLIFVLTGRRRSGMTTVFFTVSIMIHLINSTFFLVASDHFPYTATEYAELYINQQIGIWLIFIVITGLITGFFAGHNVTYKILTLFSVILYSLVFGTVRYILFLFLIQKFSILYMAPMFFVFGPIIDLLYLVSIYSRFINKMVVLYESPERKGDWQWL